MLNRALNENFPPGSTFKLVVAAAALESGQYNTDTQIPAGASYTLPGTATNLTNTSAQAAGSNGQISLNDALTWSSNTAFAQLGVKLGDEAINEQATTNSPSLRSDRATPWPHRCRTPWSSRPSRTAASS